MFIRVELCNVELVSLLKRETQRARYTKAIYFSELSIVSLYILHLYVLVDLSTLAYGGMLIFLPPLLR